MSPSSVLRRAAIKAAVAFATLSALTAPVSAADKWDIQLTPYVWGAGLGGTITPFSGAPTVRFDQSFGDILENLDGAFFVSAHAVRDRWVVMGDFSISATSRDGVVPPGLPASGKLTQTSLTLLGGYRVAEAEISGANVDVMAGARAWWVRSRVNVAGLSVAPDVDIIDPIIAVRVGAPLSARWTAVGYADVGGFGVGSDSTAQVVAAASYRIRDGLTASVGYRYLRLDYSDSRGTKLNVSMSGPIVGLTWRF